jgi:hypothetical protein
MNFNTIAVQQAKKFGHKLGSWEDIDGYKVSKCVHCAATIQVIELLLSPDFNAYNLLIDNYRVFGLREVKGKIIKTNYYTKSDKAIIICKRLASLI